MPGIWIGLRLFMGGLSLVFFYRDFFLKETSLFFINIYIIERERERDWMAMLDFFFKLIDSYFVKADFVHILASIKRIDSR